MGARRSLPTVLLKSEPVGSGERRFVQLTWTTHNVSRCQAMGAWTGARAASGSERLQVQTSGSHYELRCSGKQGNAYARVGMPTTASPLQLFPLRPSENKRYLVDARGRPFFIHGDTAWSLIAELNADEVTQYLDDRRKRGFNTVLVNLIEHKFASSAPRNASGRAPFARSNLIESPNDDYYDYAEWVVRQAEERGFLVLLVPAYLGYAGQDEGWYRALTSSSRTALVEYGRYLGRRFQKYDNVIWTYGGDYNPPDRSVVQSIAAGIREFDHNISTAHTASETSAREIWGSEPWLQLNNIYTYEHVVAKATAEYVREPAMPFFLIESSYENEQTSDVQLVRAHAYQALLSGAAGHIFGNNPIWHFSGPGIDSRVQSWQAALDSEGARNMMQLRALFDAYAWWTLTPDVTKTLLRIDHADDDHAVVASVSGDRQLAFIYFPTAATAQINMAKLACEHSCTATWFDPTAGSYGPTISLNPDGVVSLAPPARNSSGDQDWLLIINATD